MPKATLMQGTTYVDHPVGTDIDGVFFPQRELFDENNPVHLAMHGAQMDESPSVYLSWYAPKDGEPVPAYPQIGMKMTLRTLERLAEQLRTTGDPYTTLFTDRMTRGEMNEAIRQLRRARDQSYGADE